MAFLYAAASPRFSRVWKLLLRKPVPLALEVVGEALEAVFGVPVDAEALPRPDHGVAAHARLLAREENRGVNAEDARQRIDGADRKRAAAVLVGAVGLSISAAIPTKENIEMLIAKADSQMLAVASVSGYTDDSIAARLNAVAAAAPAAPAAAEPAKADEPEEEEQEVSEEEAAAGLSALFG